MLETELNRTVHIKEYFADGKFYREYNQPAVEANTRARLFMDGMKMLISKMQNMPKDSDDSVINAQTLMQEIKTLEGQFESRTGSKSDTSKLANRPPEI